MLVPYRTDAPVYHFPWATLALIGLNVLSFLMLAVSGSPKEAETVSLQHGQGLHPFQWLTSNFVHASEGHLVGNMVFLWVFGLIVEGKVGPFWFLAFWFGIGFAQCGIEQLWFMRAERNASCGASAIVAGLMAIALLWAPKNDVSCFYYFFPRAGECDLPVLLFVALFIAYDAFVVWLTSMGPTGSLFHLMGAALGLGVGWLMLRLGWVDCENWDLLSVAQGKHQVSTLPPRPRAGR